MEVYNTTFNGHEVTVIFNGGMYLFYNKYYGFIAFAKRDQENSDYKNERFALVYGNEHCTGGSLSESRILSRAKSFITKLEKQHSAETVDFVATQKDLSNSYLSIEDGFKIR